MERLPCLPGYDFPDPTVRAIVGNPFKKTRFHRSQTLGYKNGYRIPDPCPNIGIGSYNQIQNQLNEAEMNELMNYSPILTYRRVRSNSLEETVPAPNALDDKVLRFYGYFKESVTESPQENYRVRRVNIYYYLEDETMHIYEPPQPNSGLLQGWVLKRQRIPKNDRGDHFVWKDLNIGINICIYGRVYRIVNCDEFTRNFLTSEGMELNDPETIPNDPYLEYRARREQVQVNITKDSFDARRQHFELDRQVLRFFAVWDDRKESSGDLRKLSIFYFLSDDTMEVREHHTRNCGRDPCPILIRRHRFPKNRDDIPATFPTAFLEITSDEIKEFYTPRDLRIGDSIVIYGRSFLLYDCDSFTKAWYYQNFGLTDFKPIAIEESVSDTKKPEYPHCTAFGLPETSNNPVCGLKNSQTDYNHGKEDGYSTKELRYGAKLVSVRTDDSQRKFIISYRLTDKTIRIWEIPLRNSGFPGGIFLKSTRIPKPSSTSSEREYYGPNDFYIGSIINVFGTRFAVVDADEYVVKFMEAHRDQFPENSIANLSSKMASEVATKNNVDSRSCKKGGPANVQRKPGDRDKLVEDFALQLKKLACNDEVRFDALFLKYDKDRLCYVDIANLKDICKKFQLPGDEDVLNRFLDIYGTDGRMTFDEFRRFFLDKSKSACSSTTPHEF